MGQTVSLLTRIAAHRRRWKDVIALRFASTPRKFLDTTESAVISQLVALGVRLRNVDLIALPLQSDALDLVVDRAVQDEWLSGNVQEIQIGNRGKIAEQRFRTRKQFELLSTHQHFDEIVLLISNFISHVIPWPHQTEAKFWALSTMPSTGKMRNWRRLVVLNVNNVEVLVIGETHKEDGWTLSGFLNLSSEVKLPMRYRLWAHRAQYRTVGEVHQLEFQGVLALSRVLGDFRIIESVRHLVMGLLRKGKGMLERFHDYHLADEVFRKIEKSILS